MGERKENISRMLPAREVVTAEAFARRPRLFGWIEQWRDGEAWARPAGLLAVCRRALAQGEPGEERAVAVDDLERLLQPYVAAFVRTIEGWGMTWEELESEGRLSLARFFQGARGRPSGHSRMAVRDGHVVGAALLTEGRGWRETPLVLDALFVHPDCQGKGLATALLAAAGAAAFRAGWREMYSMYDPGNQASAAWHASRGFVDIPDLSLTEARLAWTRGEEARISARGGSPVDVRGARQALEAEAAALRARRDAEGWAAVSGPQRLFGQGGGEVGSAGEASPHDRTNHQQS